MFRPPSAPPVGGGGAAMPSSSVFSQIAEITDHLYLCAARAVSERALLERGVTCVINATTELPNLGVGVNGGRSIEYVKVAVDDQPFANLGAHFDRVADKIRAEANAGGKTLVHCVAGVSRSAALCIAYLVKHRGMTLLEAYRWVKGRRPIIRPNIGFFRQLIEFERRIHGRETVSLVPSAVGYIPDVYQHEYRNLTPLRSASSSASPTRPPPLECS